jgi:predicted dehydrogenase
MIRIGIIGTDAAAHLHTGALLAGSNYEIAGCYAPDNRESMVFARQYRLVSYSSLEALFKYTDVIDIAGRVPEMMALAERSLKAMKHVYIGQPNQLGMAEVQHLVKLAAESGVVLQAGSGYRYCPAYGSLVELKQKPRQIEIRHQLVRNNDDVLLQLKTELSRDLDLVFGVLHAGVNRTDIKTWTKSDGYPDMLHCRLECDNGSSVNAVLHTVSEGEPKLNITFDLPDMIVKSDVFKSTIKKQYYEYDVVDSIVLDAYNEKTVYRHDLQNFYLAVRNNPDAIRRIEEQLQSISAADIVIDLIRQSQPVTICY